jgi:hypothetical protein
VIRYANGETLIATCTDSAFFTQVDYFSIARNPSRVDAKHEDHSLQADFPVPIRGPSGLLPVCRPSGTYRVATKSKCRVRPASSVRVSWDLTSFGSALKSLYFAAIILRASTRGQAGSRWRPLPLQMRRA